MRAAVSRVAEQVLPLLSVVLIRNRETKKPEDPPVQKTQREAGPFWNVTVKVLRGRYIPKLDMITESDSYVSLRIPAASTRTHRTCTVSKSRFPKWNETFHFRVHSQVKNILELNLCDEDYLDVDCSTVLFDLNNLHPGKRERKVFALDPEEKDELWVEFEMVESKEPAGTYITNGVLLTGPLSVLEVKVEEPSSRETGYVRKFRGGRDVGGNIRELETAVSSTVQTLDPNDVKMQRWQWQFGLNGHSDRKDLVLKVNGSYEQEQVIQRADPPSGPAKPVLFHISRDLDTDLEVHGLPEEFLPDEESETENEHEDATLGGSNTFMFPLQSLPGDQQVTVCAPVGQDEIGLQLKVTDCSDQLDVRLGFGLPEEEERFLEKRRALVSRALQDVLDLPSAPEPHQVPVVAVVGSGGGSRAMTGLCGCLIGLRSLGLLDAVSYMTGVSGSTWAMSSLYANANWSQEGLETVVSELKQEISKSIFGLLSPWQLAYYLQELRQKAQNGQLVSFIDFLGLGIEYLIHGEENSSTLSSQQRAVTEGQNPFPIYTAVNMKNGIGGNADVPEWCEFTPYEVGIPKYGGFVRVEDFGSEFYMGHLIKRHPETHITYLLGLWSSVLSFNLTLVVKRLMGSVPSWITGLGDDVHDTDEQEPHKPSALDTYFIEPVGELAETLDDMVTSRPIISQNYNFLRGFNLHWNYSENDSFHTWTDPELDSFPDQMTPRDTELHLVDSGFALNSGYPPILRPQRRVDLILSFDLSWYRHQFEVLKKTAQFCADHHIPFPQIDFGSLEGQPLQECYLFKDDHNPKAPIVLHFPLTNASFREYRAPGVKRVGEAELSEGDVDVDTSDSPYRTLNLTYDPEEFQQLISLMAYNVTNNRDTILQAFRLALSKHTPENSPALNKHTPENSPTLNKHTPENSPAQHKHTPENSPAQHKHTPENSPAQHKHSPENSPAQHKHIPENSPTLNKHTPENSPALNKHTPENSPALNKHTPENSPAQHKHTPENSPAQHKHTPENSPAQHKHSPENSPAQHKHTPENSPTQHKHTPENSPAQHKHTPENSPAQHKHTPENSPALNKHTPENSPAQHKHTPENSPAQYKHTPENSPAQHKHTPENSSTQHKPEGTEKQHRSCTLL